MYIKYLSILVILFLFEGCHSKSSNVSLTSLTIPQNNDTNSQEENDNFEDEFEEIQAKPLFDPLSGYNRLMTSVNDTLFSYAVNPVSKAYAGIIPRPIRISLAHVIHNLQFPVRFSNNLLQGKFLNTTEELERFMINSTLGIAGLFDPASTYFHISAHNEDLGQTLGFYGLGTGFHVVLPLLGPSNIRDFVGIIGDGYLSPLVYESALEKIKIPQNNIESLALYGLEMVNKNALHLGAYEILKKDAMELYPYFRDLYEQKRLSDINE